MESYPLLDDFLKILAVSVPVSFLFYRLRFPSIIGFLATGVIVGPFGAGFISEPEAISSLANIGVVLLLFTIGLEFSIQQLLAGSMRVLLISVAQIVLTTGLTFAAAFFFNLQPPVALFLGFLFSLSSTAMVFKILTDRAEIDTSHGKVCVTVLLIQDLLAIPMMMMLPGLAGGTIHLLQMGKQLILAVVAVAVLFFSARYVVPLLLRQVIKTRNRDVFLVTILFVCLGTAYASSYVGLSLAIGAFIAGLVISESIYSHQILSDFLPFRDTFSAIFFISVGMLLNFPLFVDNLIVNIAVTGVVILGKAAVLLLVLLLAHYSFRISWRSALALSQIGEFSLLLAQQGRHFNIISEQLDQLFLGVSILTMFLTPFVFLIAEPTGQFLLKVFSRRTETWRAPEQADLRNDHLIIVGFGLNGRNLSRVVREVGVPFVVIELNDQLVKEAQALQIPVLFGDASSKEVLYRAGAQRARMAVIAISDAAATRRCAAVLRSMNQDLIILVRTRYVAEVPELTKLGANIVIPEEFETSVEIFARVLEKYRIPDHLIDQQIAVIRTDSYGMLRGLSLPQERLMKLSELFLKSTVAQVVIDENSNVQGMTLLDLDLRHKTGVSVIAVIRGESAITNPDSNFKIQQGDLIVLWGAHQQLADAFKLIGVNR